MMNEQKPNYTMSLLWAVLTTALCCLPFGIIAIIYANKIDPAWNSGRYEDAYKSAEKARNWSIAGAICGFILIFLYIISMVAIELMNY